MLKQNNLSDIRCLRTTKGKVGKEMLTMSQINDIRDLSQKGYSISKISSLTGLDRKTVRKYLNQDDFSPQPSVAKRRTSIVTPYLDIIEEWLEEDQKHWSKQRHTAKRIHERLQTEYGFTGSYDSVQKFVKKIRTNIQSIGLQCLSPAKKYKLYKSSINKSIHFVQRSLNSSPRGQRVTAQLNLSRE